MVEKKARWRDLAKRVWMELETRRLESSIVVIDQSALASPAARAVYFPEPRLFSPVSSFLFFLFTMI